MPPRCLAVIVLYRISLDACVSYRDLLRATEHLKGDEGTLRILLYDNSPDGQAHPLLPPGVVYQRAARNDGVAGAYNYALDLALAEGCDWLLTLDQDTSLPPQFVTEMFSAAHSLAGDTNIAAIVPQVFSGDRMISPHFYAMGALPRFLPDGFQGTFRSTLFAINSGSMLRVAALNEIGGYDPAFWLDFSDLVLFARLARAGQRVYVMGRLRVQHSLSHLDRDKPLSPTRLANGLESASAFWDSEMSRFASLMYNLVLIRHLIGMWKRRENSQLKDGVAKSILDRVVHRRRFRLERWRRSLRHRTYRLE